VTVLAAGAWRNNAELILDVRELGYLSDDQAILDPTWGLGRFWTLWHPSGLVASDLDPEKSPTGEPVDFTNLPHADETFDAVVLDPPYKLNGTGGSHPSDAGYGVATSGVSWQARHALIRLGMSESTRVLKPAGVLLLKCQDQVCSGAVRWQTDEFTAHAEAIGIRKVDRFDLATYRPQPAGRRQVHARRNYSTLLVFRKAHR
jgi:hypothetical protein